MGKHKAAFKAPGTKWYSLHASQNPVHAPDAYYNDMYSYCSLSGKNIAQSGEVVTCKGCLKKLRKNAQYANYLSVHKNIDALGVGRWSE